ncbi:ABC-type antimicrobial peptide transport system permease subunit [Chitinophaga niastensis]|uniref:ABC-type antimicrobial peptide transport system permease subunit n=1 Tax=Chitinophaga niastensis TaxID=536980 RepID=A0A2P8HEW7_CHINA|nr:ABC transporter permease [Chitinophaga niastensis]PSL44759.1 ABC-type antimicrobial peptide transport system permease subunit [Chitinophaga niastensis]
MFRNHFKIAWRHLFINKGYSAINIIGLAAGMTVALLIGLWIWDELSFNRYHQEHNSVAQVMDAQTINGEINTNEAIAIPLAAELRSKYAADFKRVALVFPNFTHTLAVSDKKLSASGIWAQPDLPEMLTLKMLKGKRDALKDPSSVLITQSLARALFGDADPLNKTIRLDNMETVQVGGVYEDLPQNTTFYSTKLILSWNKALGIMQWLNDAQTQWDGRYMKLYVQLNDHADINKINEKIKHIVQPHVKGGNEEILLHPMNKWHLYSEFKNGKVAGGRIRLIWLFGAIGALVLLLACINFMNLSTARSEKRAKEVGIRRAMGSLRGQLIGQFLSESLLLAFLAFMLAIVIAQVSLPFFNRLTEKQMSVPFAQPLLWVLLIGFTLFTGFISGSYPAFYLSAFLPVKVLKGSFRMGRFASLPRKVLMVVQFTVSIVLIIGTVVVYQQIQYAKKRPVGYTRERLITVTMNTPEIFGASYNALRNELIETGVVTNMTKSSTQSTEAPVNNTEFNWKGKNPGATPMIGLVEVTHDYGNTLNWHIKEGRDFSRSYATDSGSLILNEAAVKLTGFKHPVGETISFGGENHVITGTVEDMVMESPYRPVQPTIFLLKYSPFNALAVCIKPTIPIREALSRIEPVFKKFNPGGPFDYKFTDEEYARKFSDEERISKLVTVFAILAIFISCLGVFGLASFIAEQRTKEIGVRKVLGASVVDVLGLLSKDFVMLVIIALLIASPLAYYFMFNWLKNYQYRTGLSGWVFVMAGFGALLMTLLTISYQSIKAALMNPTKSLRGE